MDKTFVNFHRLLSLAGIPFFTKDKRKLRIRNSFQILNFFVGILVIVFTTIFVLTSKDDIQVLIQGACIWTTGVISFMSLAVSLFLRNEYCNLINEMAFKDIILDVPFIGFVLENGKKNKMGELKTLVVSSQEKLLKLMGTVLKLYLLVVWSCFLLYLFGAIYQMCLTKDEYLRALPFEMRFFWSLENFNVYLATFAFNTYSGFLCSLMYPGLQTTIILLLGQFIRQLKILTFILQNLSDLVSEMVPEKDERWHHYCSVLFQQTLIHYIRVKRLSNQLNKICQPVYLTLILVSTLLVCVCSVKIAISDKLSVDLLKHYIHVLGFILMIFMFCSTGQQVENECEKLEEAVTDKWYIYNRNQKVDLYIFQIGLGQRMPIYIFGTVKLDLPTFTWFIKTGMSFFTIVMSVLED